ncbi:NAD(P)/FAD-dependent oxidoreductase [Mesoflavibacter sp. SCSIO 43206]|uniref:NAD(P)/FAD-dependent oxidoreductase n=1 Tax=Mesoflavibacter sp. SCSIO 43206 TaxID=2779362 RepID=UPI001CA8BB38|nr:NAD(P)/FAD-dependent oxidoreductase [Mesoflavibacter sp. SCSIO 43206]UAB76058.1 NAD(P)/FAD-dependent oxidoreductase [Mesoflavibacter sp. SCSIO 43206]
MKYFDVIIVGGGAAGFFAAINIAEQYPDVTVAILEKSKEVLSKVKVSGGGRCNVTHAEFIPQELVKNYPRGEKELLGPFHTFMTGDTMEWFERKGVPLKIEEDGRIFPESNSSQTIIDCFLYEAKKLGVEVIKQQVVTKFNKDEYWQVNTKTDLYSCEKLIIATGSSAKIWTELNKLGHNIVQPVPSLFTFNINDSRIKEIPGVVAQNVTVKVLGTNLETNGPLLITHWGMSAPAILKLSAFGAVELAEKQYNFQIEINFINQDYDDTLSTLKQIKIDLAKKVVVNYAMFDLPKRLWNQLVLAAKISAEARWADINKYQLEQLSNQLTKAIFNVKGKSTFKEEFVTAGGIDLKEVNFKNYQSKLFENLYFAGEVINVDAITGGFNFQNAWTGAYILSKNLF